MVLAHQRSCSWRVCTFGTRTGIARTQGGRGCSRLARHAFEMTKREVHDGMYKQWQVDDRDIAEVLAYRGGIAGTAIATVLVALSANTSLIDLPPSAVNAVCACGALSLGMSLYLVHMYVTAIKRIIQALFVAGMLGGGWIAFTQDTSVVTYVAEHPLATFLIGPAFAAVTGLAVKEGLCYAKVEAAVLAFVTPAWLLTHLVGSASPGADRVLASAYAATFAFFAARKFSQRIKDDIGDKSIFEFMTLPESEQQAAMQSESDVQRQQALRMVANRPSDSE